MNGYRAGSRFFPTRIRATRTRVDHHLAILYSSPMTATEIIHEIDSLPPAELAVVVRYTKQLEEIRQLSPEELGVLVDKFVEATDPMEVARLREEITEGFYGRR